MIGCLVGLLIVGFIATGGVLWGVFPLAFLLLLVVPGVLLLVGLAQWALDWLLHHRQWEAEQRERERILEDPETEEVWRRWLANQ